MQKRKTAIIAGSTLLLIFVAYAVSGAFWQSDSVDGKQAARSQLSRLFSNDNGNLEDRIRKLETSLEDANQIQSQLLEVVEELRARLERYAPTQSAEDIRTAALTSSPERHGTEHADRPSRRDRYSGHRDHQLQRLIDAGINPDRAEFILDKQERFQYEHMQLSYQYRHVKDKSSAEAERLRRQLDRYSHPRKYFEHELGEQEFELYLEANGGRQEMRIDRVVSDTPASGAGLQAGDKIISYNGERVFHMGDLRTQVYKVAPGKTVAIEVQREGSSSREVIYVPSGPLGIQG
ncbi:PDZ domain-containing protein [Microbulbifer marinus]|uniref:PDZ domain-containing protein n=1 Tax=Microbulbifer marinus TaxID=658218 RepID=A0A1H3WP23_9GAMM|nr:PDZ domain-containing protein [Microbulbifer marinus]SDZ88102.1 PDZ domain-containing protein [Microbulbifer marinus]